MTIERRAQSPVKKVVDAFAMERANQAADAQGMNMSTPFGPGEPIRPWDGYRNIPRTWDFMPGYNLKTRADRDGRLSFAALKSLINAYDVANLCIEHRIDDVRSLPWVIRAADWATGDTDAVIAQARKILRKPDGKHMFRPWLAMWIRDILRYDAGTLYKQRNYLGDTIGLKVVDGTTIAPLQDAQGDRPSGDAPAFVQIIQGTVWEWLTEDDLIYEPFRPAADSPYGFTAIETALLTANTDLRFQQHWLNWFTEGDIPEGFATAPADVTTPEQLERWEAFWHAMNAGDDRIKHRLKFIPNGTKLDFPKEKSFDAVFPLFLMRKMCAAFHVTPNDIGFTDDVNRATGETQVDVQFRIGTLPLVQHIEDILTAYLQDDRGLPVVFEFDKGGEKEDRVATAQADKIYIESGVVSVSEVRERVYGLVDDSERPVPRFIFSTRQGPIPLVSLFEVAGVIDPLTALPAKEQPLMNHPYAGTPGVLPEKEPGSVAYQRADFNPDEPEYPDQEKPIPGSGVISPQNPTPVAARKRSNPFDLSEDARRDLVKWRGSSVRRVAKGQTPKMFESDHIPDFIADTVWTRLRSARTREQVDAVFTAVRKAVDGETPDGYDEDGADQLPKADGWRAQPAKTTPQMHQDLRLVDEWLDRLRDAIAAIYTAGAIRDVVQAVSQLFGTGGGDTPDTIKAYAQLQIAARQDATAAEHAHGVYNDMRADAYLAGKTAAMVQIRSSTEDLEAFKDWAPGRPTSIDEASRWTVDRMDRWDGIDRTTLLRLADVLYDGLSKGESIDDMTGRMTDYITDANRAEMIVHTESARMLSAASLEAYTAAGITQWDWLVSSGACPICLEKAASNPHTVRDDTPPGHPRCRCSVAPVKTNWGTTRTGVLDSEHVLVNGEPLRVIGRDEARGNARPVTAEEFAQVAGQGKALLDEMRANASPITGLTNNLDAIKASTYQSILQSWGGQTIDSHTGQAIASDANKYAVTVKASGQQSVSVGENPTQEDWEAAVDEAVKRFGDTLTNSNHYLGVFHDDENHRVDIDPVVVVDTQAESEAIGAYTHNIGGAYNFADGNGYWPPYVDGSIQKAKGGVKTEFRGIGEWYAQAKRLNGEA